MKKSDSEKYFAQKTFSAFEIVCFSIMGLSVIAFLFIWGWGSIGLVTLLFSGGGFLFSRSLRVKDSDIDELIDEFAKENKIELDSEALIKIFDFKSQYAAVGKDGKTRTGVFVTSEYVFDGDKELASKYLVPDTDYEVYSIDMGSWMTDIYLIGYKYGFNSIYFDFYEDGKEIDIYKDPRFNPYL